MRLQQRERDTLILAAERTGIPAANIVVAATHSHTAPDYGKEMFQVLADTPGEATRAAYIDRLIHGTADAIANAHANAAPAQLFGGAAIQETPVAFVDHGVHEVRQRRVQRP